MALTKAERQIYSTDAIVKSALGIEATKLRGDFLVFGLYRE